VPTATFRRN